jgi:hypothetical protein
LTISLALSEISEENSEESYERWGSKCAMK